MARPKKEPDINFKNEFEKLCGLQCTKEEICDWFMISDKTLDRWIKELYDQSFSEVFRQKRSRGSVTLRRYQFTLAKKSATMAIWLGKQYLNQNEELKGKYSLKVEASEKLADVFKQVGGEGLDE